MNLLSDYPQRPRPRNGGRAGARGVFMFMNRYAYWREIVLRVIQKTRTGRTQPVLETNE